MENYDDIFGISEESLAAWLDGTLSPEEDIALSERISSDFQLAEILDAYEDIESGFEHLIEEGYEIPAELSFDFQPPEIECSDNFTLHDDTIDSPYECFERCEWHENQNARETIDDPNEFNDDSPDTLSEDFMLF